MSNKRQLGAIGLDIGGTKTAAGVVLWPSGEVLQRTVVPTNPARGGDAVLQDILNIAGRLHDWAESQDIEVNGIGAGVAELVDCEGNVTSSCTIQWRDVPVQKELSKIAPATVESDVRAAALAEAVFGAGQEHRNFVYVTVGTGISYCLVQDGRPFKGANGNAIMLASSPLSTVCSHCGTKLRPVLEEFASGPAMARRFAEAGGKPQENGSHAGGCEAVFRAAADNNQTALEILASSGEALGVSTAFLVNVLDPEIVIVGGGLGMAGGAYWDSFERACREHIFADNSRDVPIVTAKLGVDAGLIGAGAAVFSRQDASKPSYAHEKT